jgi:23S rRNA (cytidine1920-2'-O)/16S rRNA (cytidine1409-2'-O)-methyltransferase
MLNSLRGEVMRAGVMAKRERIDLLLVERGLVESRTRAQALIMAGRVFVNGQRVMKASESFARDVRVEIKGADDPLTRYVSRGGAKLEAALDRFQLDVRDLLCLDVGASTGGFTDCLLRRGARRVVALDVGRGQLDWQLRNDPRVEVREGINARHLRPEDFPERFDLITVDVSFISVTKILPVLVPLLKDDGRMVVLIKPQFEVGRGEVGRGGVVRDAAKRERAAAMVNEAAQALGLKVRGMIESPVRGAEGNVEFLALYEKEDGEVRGELDDGE